MSVNLTVCDNYSFYNYKTEGEWRVLDCEKGENAVLIEIYVFGLFTNIIE